MKPQIKKADFKIDLPKGPTCPVCFYPLWEKPCSVCLEAMRKDTVLLAGYVKAIGGAKAWDNYRDQVYIKTQCNSKAYKAAKAWHYKQGSILFHGPRGTGKSHLAAIIKRPIILAGLQVLTVSMPEVLSEIKANISDGKILDGWVSRMSNAQVLSIEDMAVEKASEFVVEFYYRVIDNRYKADKPGMIITMNQDLPQLEHDWLRFDQHGRVVSRLKEMCRGNVLSLIGEKDHREG